MPSLDFQIDHKAGAARAATLTTGRGKIHTPCFMPVGTRAAVRTLTSQDLEDLSAEIILANTYHLMLRPGDELIASQGGLHNFMDWQKPILTDSGGFQVLSLEPRINETGAVFKSVYDGSEVSLTPEKAVEVQTNLGADIQMVLDVCPPLSPEGKNQEAIKKAVELTEKWAVRARQSFLENPAATKRGLAQFGIVQGGADIELRLKSAEKIKEIGFEGYALGGLSVGETQDERRQVIKPTAAALPENAPRYLMGVGDPVSLVEAIACGIDMFDCVLPTRLARHGTALTSRGKLNIKAAAYTEDASPLDPEFDPSFSQKSGASSASQYSRYSQYSRSYLRHLFSVGEPSAARILTLHNLAWILDLMKRAQVAIAQNKLDLLVNEIKEVWSETDARPHQPE